MSTADLSVVITTDSPQNIGLDYDKLVAEGLVIVQALSGEVWTDYNEHDPGVTTLEQLAYALTELSYRAEFPMASLLTRRDGNIDTRLQAMFIARRIFPVSPVTLNDYRKLLIDRVSGVQNVWLTPLPALPPHDTRGLYSISVYAPGVDPCVCDGHVTPEEVQDRIKRVFCRHRSLCEDVEQVTVLSPLTTVVRATLVVSDTQSPETVLGTALFQLSAALAPEVKRVPLQTLLLEGKSPDEIFNGPLEKNGFIQDNTLAPKPDSVSFDEVLRSLSQSPGVLSVRDLTVQVGSVTLNGPGQSTPIGPDQIPALYTGLEPGQQITFRLIRRGIVCSPNRALTRAVYLREQAERRRTYPLLPAYEAAFAVPSAPYKDLSVYTSIQTQFPAVYGINDYGVPTDQSAARKAQAKQFKGYLLAFEQILTNFFAQLNQAKNLFSTNPTLEHTYFYQSLVPSVPNVEPLLYSDYEEGLSSIVNNSDPVTYRRNRIAEMLLAMFQENVTTANSANGGCDHTDTGGPGKDVLKARLALLNHMVAATRDRGRGFDYLALPSAWNIAGMEIKSRIQLGLPVFRRRSLLSGLEELGMTLVEDENLATLGASLGSVGDESDPDFEEISRDSTPDSTPPPEGAFAPPLLRMHAVTEETVRAASDITHYRIGTLPGEWGVSVVCRAPGDDSYRLIARMPTRVEGERAAYRMADGMSRIRASLAQLYIVEHVLLRYGDPPARGGFEYSFAISAVVGLDSQSDTEAYRDLTTQVLRENAPAHVDVQMVFLRPRSLIQFETRLRAWQRALRKGTDEEKRSTSSKMIDFLVKHAAVES
ncbi:MAG: hypothetical protein IPK82_00765 [Polyangiaceae bacterium]|nr:hypothetical protein [Polyangiaceae bacterium]